MLKKPIKKFSVSTLLTTMATVVSLMATIAYVTWFAASIDKRVSLLEQHDVSSQERFHDMRAVLDQANKNQDQAIQEFQNSFDAKLARLDDKMDKILFILSENKKI